MWRRIVLGLGGIVVVLGLLVAAQPSSFRVERSAAIEAPPELVYRHIESLRAMDAWSPWAKMDPEMQIAYAGPEAGVGARSAWEGPQMGKGRLTIVAAKPAQQVEMKLEMLAPMEASNRILFTLVPAGGATRVTWSMDGETGFVGKAIGLVMDHEQMVGEPFEKGLASLKATAEAEAARRSASG